MVRSQNLGILVCGGVSYVQLLPFHMVVSYSRVSTVFVEMFLVKGRIPGNTDRKYFYARCPVQYCTY